jgi:hypothetical protein
MAKKVSRSKWTDDSLSKAAGEASLKKGGSIGGKRVFGSKAPSFDRSSGGRVKGHK